MNRRTALVLTITLTAFVLVVIGGLIANAGRTTSTPPTSPASGKQMPIPQLAAVPSYAVSGDQASQLALQSAPGAVLQLVKAA